MVDVATGGDATLFHGVGLFHGDVYKRQADVSVLRAYCRDCGGTVTG